MGEAKRKRRKDYKYRYVAVVVSQEDFLAHVFSAMAGDQTALIQCKLVTNALAECMIAGRDPANAKLCLTCEATFSENSMPCAFAVTHLLNNPDKGVASAVCCACHDQHSDTYLAKYLTDRCIGDASDFTEISEPAYNQ